jgi:hypothetical protein
MVGKVCLLDLLLEAGHLVFLFISFAEFLLNCLELFAEDIFALALPDLGLRVAGDLVPELKNLDFLRKRCIQGPQQLGRGRAFEQFLLFLHREIEQRSHTISQRYGILFIAEGDRSLLNTGSLNQSGKVCDQFLDRPVKGLSFGADVSRLIEPAGLHEQIGLALLHLEQGDPVEPLNQRLDRAVVGTPDLLHEGLGADRIEIIQPRRFLLRVTLRDDEDRFVFCFQRRIHGGDRPLTSDRQWHHDSGKEHGPFDWEDGQCHSQGFVIHVDVFLLSVDEEKRDKGSVKKQIGAVLRKSRAEGMNGR